MDGGKTPAYIVFFRIPIFTYNLENKDDKIEQYRVYLDLVVLVNAMYGRSENAKITRRQSAGRKMIRIIDKKKKKKILTKSFRILYNI